MFSFSTTRLGLRGQGRSIWKFAVQDTSEYGPTFISPGTVATGSPVKSPLLSILTKSSITYGWFGIPWLQHTSFRPTSSTWSPTILWAHRISHQYPFFVHFKTIHESHEPNASTFEKSWTSPMASSRRAFNLVGQPDPSRLFNKPCLKKEKSAYDRAKSPTITYWEWLMTEQNHAKSPRTENVLESAFAPCNKLGQTSFVWLIENHSWRHLKSKPAGHS